MAMLLVAIFVVWVVGAVCYLRLLNVGLGALARRSGDTFDLPVEDQNRLADLLRERHIYLLQAAGDYNDPITRGIRDEADHVAHLMQLFGGASRMPHDSPTEIERDDELCLSD
jgi:hypothetical protein